MWFDFGILWGTNHFSPPTHRPPRAVPAAYYVIPQRPTSKGKMVVIRGDGYSMPHLPTTPTQSPGTASGTDGVDTCLLGDVGGWGAFVDEEYVGGASVPLPR